MEERAALVSSAYNVSGRAYCKGGQLLVSEIFIMGQSATLDQVEALAAQLPPREQLKLVARISDRLSGRLPNGAHETANEETLREQRSAKADALLAELDAIAESIEGEFDSAQDIRESREERLRSP